MQTNKRTAIKTKSIINHNKKYYTIKEVRQLIREEFNVTYSEKQVGIIIREKLNLTYKKTIHTIPHKTTKRRRRP